jgi:hypothetical protein
MQLAGVNGAAEEAMSSGGGKSGAIVTEGARQGGHGWLMVSLKHCVACAGDSEHPPVNHVLAAHDAASGYDARNWLGKHRCRT